MEPRTYHCEECKQRIEFPIVQKLIKCWLVVGECNNPACKLYHTGQTLDSIPFAPDEKKGA